jgi:hypothetical protein
MKAENSAEKNSVTPCFVSILDLALSIFVKMVYIVLYAFANKDGFCYLSIKTIAEKASCSRSKVFDALRTLEEIGIIARSIQIYENGGKTSNLYKIIDIAPRPQCGPRTPQDGLGSPQCGLGSPECGLGSPQCVAKSLQDGQGQSVAWMEPIQEVDSLVEEYININKALVTKTQEYNNKKNIYIKKTPPPPYPPPTEPKRGKRGEGG